ncbi:DUF2267 domain-containing protein [Kitasatospora sp. DSM 101779]|uniref:DUF2267 domain-containing protein n=1 Tax=Kitasatospora sp. DSM 101779 TaxID=2853165 RepID=UPI0021DA2FF1|nr:DUF2267 domain-containing protein [Kitasatospora sp. DSM 101779]MCU7826812.1 DUF2267 domain-containing protein [Kitasatospora sp. DSM 101779]
MEHEEFLRLVRDAGGYEDDGTDEAVTTVLGLLGELLGTGPAEALADQLPDELGDLVLPEPDVEAASWTAEGFIGRLAEARDTTVDEAAVDASAVLRAVAEAVDDSELDALVTELPAGFSDLLGHPELA